jgi:transposase
MELYLCHYKSSLSCATPIIEQAKAIEQLKSRVLELEKKIQELKVSRDLDSTISSKPPSADLLKKTENYPVAQPSESQTRKRKPGGQPGHPGKTRKGLGRVSCCTFKL